MKTRPDSENSPAFMQGDPVSLLDRLGPASFTVPCGFQGPDHRRQIACRTDPAQLPTGDPSFSAARDLAQGNRYRRAELQARILADQPVAEIANRMGIPITVVEAFESWFFDVRTR